MQYPLLTVLAVASKVVRRAGFIPKSLESQLTPTYREVALELESGTEVDDVDTSKALAAVSYLEDISQPVEEDDDDYDAVMNNSYRRRLSRCYVDIKKHGNVCPSSSLAMIVPVVSIINKEQALDRVSKISSFIGKIGIRQDFIGECLSSVNSWFITNDGNIVRIKDVTDSIKLIHGLSYCFSAVPYRHIYVKIKNGSMVVQYVPRLELESAHTAHPNLSQMTIVNACSNIQRVAIDFSAGIYQGNVPDDEEI